MSKLRILAGLIALLAVGAVVYVRASNTGDTAAAKPAAADDSTCDSCCGPVVPEPIKTAVPAGQTSPYSAEPAAAPAKN